MTSKFIFDFSFCKWTNNIELNYENLYKFFCDQLPCYPSLEISGSISTLVCYVATKVIAFRLDIFSNPLFAPLETFSKILFRYKEVMNGAPSNKIGPVMAPKPFIPAEKQRSFHTS